MCCDGWTLCLALLLGAVTLSILWWRHHARCFARRGVPYISPVLFVGNMLPMMLRKKSLHDVTADLYQQLEPHSYGGVFSFAMPILMLRDPDVIRAVTVKDFDHFTDHVNFFSGRTSRGNPLVQRMLIALKGKEWHNMRAILSPAFTSMKMKNMFVLMAEIGQQMIEHLTKETAQVEGDILTLEMKDFCTRLTNDIIATTAFGIKVDSLADPNNTFYSMGRDLTTMKVSVITGYMISPKLMEVLGIPLISAKAIEYFKSMVLENIQVREKEGIVRHDMIHLLMQARRGELQSEEEKNGATEEKGKPHLTDDDVAAQAMIFFFGGFETVSTVMVFCSYLLATHEDIQRRLQKEVDEVMQKSGGRPSYENVMACQYLDMVISETLRMYVPIAAMDRQCVRSYKLPATESCPEVELRPGDAVWIPAHGIHHDPKYFPEAERFNPERFSPENKHLIAPFTYYPFGSGPRFCIAQRFALMEVKVVFLYLLSQFSLEVVPKTPVSLRIQPNKPNLTIEGGAWIGIRRRS